MSAGPGVVGILLAAGHGRRWAAAGGGGDKLLHRLADGTPMAVAAARALMAALPRAVAVVRPGEVALARVLGGCGLRVVWSDPGSPGLGHSLAKAVSSMAQADGWVVALGDMPHVRPDTIAAVADALRAGHGLAAPFHDGCRGHPVGFGRAHRRALEALRGDVGARDLLTQAAAQLHRLGVDDPGVLTDVDEPRQAA